MYWRMVPAPSYSSTVDAGIWTLRCTACGQRFTLELGHGTPLMAYLKNHPCPLCHKVPGESVLTWHSIEDFKLLEEDC